MGGGGGGRQCSAVCDKDCAKVHKVRRCILKVFLKLPCHCFVVITARIDDMLGFALGTSSLILHIHKIHLFTFSNISVPILH